MLQSEATEKRERDEVTEIAQKSETLYHEIELFILCKHL
jgi:hypothetical protein